MSKKSFTILVIVFLIVALLGLGIVWYIHIKNANGGAPVTVKDFFPFGQGGTTVTNPPTTEPSGTGDVQQPPTGSTFIPRLRKVSENPVVGYTTLVKSVPVDPNNLPPPEHKAIVAAFTFGQDLKKGDSNADITELQKELNQCPATQVAATGSGSPGKEGKLFGAATEKAVIAFQNLFPDLLTAQGGATGSGIVDGATRAKLNAGFDCVLAIKTPESVLKAVARYVEQGNSNIYDAFADTLEKTRLSNTTIPRVHDARFANNGQTVFMRYLSADNQTINTFIGNVQEPKVGGDALPELSGSLMPKNITDLSVSPDGKQVFFFIESGENLLGFVSDIDGKNQKKIFSSPFYDWLSQWATQSQLLFTVKATGYATGFAYTSDAQTGGLVKVAGPLTGLTTLMSPDGKYILLSRNTASGPALGLETVATKQIRDLKLNTLPEKCSWTSNSLSIYCAVPDTLPLQHVYPDDWYQGTLIFSDSFWVIDATGTYGNQELFAPLSEGGEATDGINLSVDSDNNYFYFMNKDTGYLWQYALVPPIQPDSTTPAQ